MEISDPIQNGLDDNNKVSEETPHRCSNCFRKYSKKCLPSKKFYYEFYENGIHVRKNVLISDALQEICKWRLFGFAQGDLDQNFTNVRVCGNLCGVAIAKLYGAIKIFDSLTHSDSHLNFVMKKILDKFVDVATTANLIGSTNYRKSSSHLMSRRSRKSKDGIGNEILNRPLTEYVTAVDKQDSSINLITLAEQPLVGFLDSTEYQLVSGEEPVNDPIFVEIHNENETQNFILVNASDEKTLSNPFATSESGGDVVETAVDKWTEQESFDQDESISSEKSTPVLKPYLCQLCGAGLTSRQGLRTHELLTHKVVNGREKIFPCDHCGKEFFFEYLLKNHLPRHSTQRNFSCTLCTLKFKGKITLKQHMKDVHDQQETRFHCKFCPNKSFKHKRTLWDHTKSHHGNKGKALIFSCQYGCGSTSSRSRSLLHHHRICHKRPREGQVLDVAIQSISTANLTEEELEQIDDGGKRLQIYPCTWDCGKVFTTKFYRARHTKDVCRKRPNLAKGAAKRKGPTRKRPRTRSNKVISDEVETSPSCPSTGSKKSESIEEVTDESDTKYCTGEKGREAIQVELSFG